MSVGLLEISEYISEEDRDFLEEGLAEHIAAQGAPELTFTPLSILKRDDDEQIVAGLYGETLWNWLYVDSLWVDVSLRGKGMGTAILKAAEEEAQRRGCLGVYLWTQSFDAPEFYEKLGYTKYAEVDDFPIGHQRYGFMKRIA